MLGPWASGFKEILIGFSNEFLCLKNLAQGAAKLWTLKVCGQKKLRHFGFEATPFATLYSELLLSGRPGFKSRSLQTLRASNFELKPFDLQGQKLFF